MKGRVRGDRGEEERMKRGWKIRERKRRESKRREAFGHLAKKKIHSSDGSGEGRERKKKKTKTKVREEEN